MPVYSDFLFAIKLAPGVLTCQIAGLTSAAFKDSCNYGQIKLLSGNLIFFFATKSAIPFARQKTNYQG